MSTRMWEARARPDAVDALVTWAVQHAAREAQVYRGGDDRVVVIDPTGVGLPAAPDGLLARPAHVWDFEPVRRT